MRNIFLIAKSNLRKKKSNIILIFLLVIISTVLLYTSVNVITDVNKFLDRLNKKQNGPDLTMISDSRFTDKTDEILKSYNGYDYSEKDKVLLLNGGQIKNINNNKEEKWPVLFFNMDNKKHINNYQLIGGTGEKKENSIILPAFLYVSKGYEIGDKIKISNGSEEYTFEVYGFMEDIMFATTSNVTMVKCMISNEMINKISENNEAATVMNSYDVKLKYGYDGEDYEKYVSDKISKEILDPSFMLSLLMNYSTMKMATAMYVNIIMAVVSIFAVIIVIISLIVIRFSIITNIEENIKNIGMLQSIGYTTKQLRIANILEYILVVVIGSILGLLISNFSTVFVNQVVSSAIGLVWTSKFNFIIAMLGFLFLVISVLLNVFICTGRYKKITPLNALRNGINTHNFRKNYIQLHKSILGLNSSLGIKEIFHNKKQNISIGIIVMLLTFACVITTGIYYNFVINQSALSNIVGMEKPDLMVSFSDVNLEKNETIEKEQQRIFKEIEARNDVKDTLFSCFKGANLQKGNNNMSLTLTVVDHMDKLRFINLIEGRIAKHDNEVVISNVVAENLGVKLGDTIYIETIGKKEDFIVVGINQQLSNLGRSAKITEEGMKRIVQEFNKGNELNVYLKNGTDINEVVEELNNKYKNSNITVTNFSEAYDSIVASFTEGVALMSIICCVVTILVVILILFMVIKMKLLKDRKTFGVYKALGYTTKQLMWQTTMNFAPVISIGALVGIMLGIYLVNPVFTLMLSMAGIAKSTLYISPVIYISIFLIITILAFGIANFSARKVRKIEAYKMITE